MAKCAVSRLHIAPCGAGVKFFATSWCTSFSGLRRHDRARIRPVQFLSSRSARVWRSATTRARPSWRRISSFVGGGSATSGVPHSRWARARWWGGLVMCAMPASKSESPMQKADSRSASICSSAICEVNNIYDFQGEQVRRWVGVLPQVPGMGALAFAMRNDSGRILLKI